MTTLPRGSLADLPAAEPEFILEPLKISDLRLDGRYQRALRETDVDELVKNYRQELFQPLVVGMRKDGSLHVVDGQHRLAAARRMEWITVPAQIFDSKGFEHEALIYELLQTRRRALSTFERWKARVARADPKAVAIENIVHDLGLRISHESAPMVLQGVVACEAAFERGNLKQTLEVIISAWQYDMIGFRRYFIEAVSLFLSTLRAEDYKVDYARVSAGLAKISPSNYLREVALTSNKYAVFFRMLLDVYNKGQRGAARVDIEDPKTAIDMARRKVIGQKQAVRFASNRAAR